MVNSSCPENDATLNAVRSIAVRPWFSAMTLALPVGTDPSPITVARKMPRASACSLPVQADKASCARYRTTITGNSSASTASASKAERVPVIIRATPLKATNRARTAIWSGPRARAKSHTENGTVHTTYSANMLRLTKVDAGFGPCGNRLKSTKNCSTVHKEAATAPQWMALASNGSRSRVNVLRPSHKSRLKMNQRIASTPAR